MKNTDKVETYIRGGAAGAIAYAALSFFLPNESISQINYIFGALGAACAGGMSFSLLEDIINKTN